jgi:hypothetical protein
MSKLFIMSTLHTYTLFDTPYDFYFFWGVLNGTIQIP